MRINLLNLKLRCRKEPVAKNKEDEMKNELSRIKRELNVTDKELLHLFEDMENKNKV